MFAKLKKKLKNWWYGKHIEMHSGPYDRLFFGSPVHQKHWTSRFAHWVVSLISNPEKRARLLAIIAVATFLILLAKNLSHSESNQQPANIGTNNGEPQRQVAMEQN